MSDAKKVEIEITNAKVIIPQSIHEVQENRKHLGKIVSLGEVVEVYEDVAEKLERNFQASRVTKESPASIAKTLEENDEAKRERMKNLAKPADESEDDKPKKKTSK